MRSRTAHKVAHMTAHFSSSENGHDSPAVRVCNSILVCAPATASSWHDGAPDLGPALEALNAGAVPTVVIGEVAGALRGWPLVLSGTGTVAVCEERKGVGEQLLANGLTESEDLLATAAGQRISVIAQPPGTTGSRDLLRGAQTLDLPTGGVQVAGVLGLRGSPVLGMAVVGAGRASRSRRSSTSSALVPPAHRGTASNEERLHAWLDQQAAA